MSSNQEALAYFALGVAASAAPLLLGKPGTGWVKRDRLVVTFAVMSFVVGITLADIVALPGLSGWHKLAYAGCEAGLVAASLLLQHRRIAGHWLLTRRGGWTMPKVFKAIRALLSYYPGQEVLVRMNYLPEAYLSLWLQVGAQVRVPLRLRASSEYEAAAILRLVYGVFAAAQPSLEYMQWVAIRTSDSGEKATYAVTCGETFRS